MSLLFPRRQAMYARQVRGFSLIEVMVAMVLGMLLSIGIIALFSNSNSLNRTQEALARLQENGRYAVTRMTDDLRSSLSLPVMAEVNSQAQLRTANGVLLPPMAPTVYVANLQNFFPRWLSGTIMPTGWGAGTPYPMSPRWLLQGHECAVGATGCTPTVPTTLLPAVGSAAGNRVRGADVLTTRVLSSQGWTLIGGGGSVAACSGNALQGLAVTPLANEPATNFQNNDIAMVWQRNGGQIFQVTVTGAPGSTQTLAPTNVLGTAPATVPCPQAARGGDEIPVLYNLSRDLRTITYFVQLVADPNPDATAGRLIPTLMRWVEGAPVNTRTAEVVASGVERLDFIYGVEDRSGAVRYLSASDLETASTAANCMTAPRQYEALAAPNNLEPGCLWRSVRSIEAHMLLNTVNNIYTLSNADMAYRYSVNGGTAVTYAEPAAPGATLPNGLTAGRMMRREFSVQVALRNSLP